MQGQKLKKLQGIGVSRCSERHGVGVRVPARHGLDSLLDAQQGHLELLRKAELTGKYFKILDKNIYCILHLAVGHQLLLLPEGSVFLFLLPRSQHHRSVLVRPSALNTTLTILLS